jgi:N-acetylglucosamine kinase-like BadF-type ATPase
MTKPARPRTVYVDVGGTNTRFVVGLRGVWSSSEKKKWKKRLAHLSPNIEIVSDIELAHRRAFGEKPGIVLNAGTGSIAYGRAGTKTARAGGVGPLLGDEGSAFWIGRAYLQRTKGHDWKFLRRIAVGKNPVATIAGYARFGLNDKRIANQAQNDLLVLVRRVASELGGRNKWPLVLQGGLFNNPAFRRRFVKRVRPYASPI